VLGFQARSPPNIALFRIEPGTLSGGACFSQGKPAGSRFRLARAAAAAKRHRGGIGLLREGIGRLCLTREQIGYAELHRDMDHARRHVPGDELPQIGRCSGIRIVF
jgi:hypothetical protein